MIVFFAAFNGFKAESARFHGPFPPTYPRTCNMNGALSGYRRGEKRT